MIRAFLALTPPPETAQTLAELAERIGEGRPVPAANMHLTLAFLGDRRPAELEELALDLDGRALPAFDLRIEGLGAFGPPARPRSVHALARPDPALRRLRAAARSAAAAIGAPLAQERFVPHLTLARFSASRPAGPGLARFLAQSAGLRLPPFRVAAFSLMRSTLSAAGARYDEMARFALSPPAHVGEALGEDEG
ncbi:RNA 2',3'-cyclic phosphodiesterase [Oceanicella actignis]|uniref:RNA 2',3'-cyclic phosphodiesterase n=1 Tax=Oceanicella actignis TaxID=1189325 RepID=UPI00125ACCE7|nr:RNA 2',3'-cyclic phosphodiesterase [Oceanicella actignis]TYO89581.1 2'-5' RNA ligase [Oceanicella actignis]